MEYRIDIKYTPQFLREMPPGDIEELLDLAQRKFFELREQSAPAGHVKVVDKPHLFKKIKRDIARMKTVLRESGMR